MVNIDSADNLSSWKSQVTGQVSGDDVVSHVPPLCGPVKALVYVAIKSEGVVSDRPIKFKILEPIPKRLQPL